MEIEKLRKPQSGYKLISTVFNKFEEIPEDWSIEKIGTLLENKIILQIQDGNHGDIHPKQKDFVDEGIPFIAANCLKNNRVNLTKCKFLPKKFLKTLRIGFTQPNDVLLTHKASLGFCTVLSEEPPITILSPQATYYRLSEKFLPKFLYFIFQSYFFKRQFLPLGSQSTRDYVGILAQRDILIPNVPLPQQEKIVSIMSNLESLIERVQNLIKNTIILKKGVSRKLLLEGIGHTKFKEEISNFRRTIQIPNDWEMISLNEMKDDSPHSFVDGPFGSNLKVSDFTTSGVPVIQLNNIGIGEFLPEDIKFTSTKKFEELKTHAAYPDELVIAKMAEPVARTCIVPSISKEYLIVADCMKLKVNDKKYSSKYLQYLLNFPYVMSLTESFASGTTRLRINLSELKKVRIPIGEKPEQDKIVSKIENIEFKIKNYQEYESKLQILKEGLIQQLIGGRTKVKI